MADVRTVPEVVRAARCLEHLLRLQSKIALKVPDRIRSRFAWSAAAIKDMVISSAISTNSLHRAAAARGEHEKRTGRHDDNWPDGYADYIVREQVGELLPE